MQGIDDYIRIALSRLYEEYGLFPKIGSELEFYIDYKNEIDEEIDPHIVSALRDAISDELAIGLEKEKGQNQYEVIIPHQRDLKIFQDSISKTRSTIISATKKLKLHCTFRPKPKATDFGSGMHYHLTLHQAKDGVNVFDTNAHFLTQVIAGMLYKLYHALQWLLHNEDYDRTINSEEYKRFVPRFMAPTNISWGGNNRTTAIRIPEMRPKRIELRIPSPITSVSKVIALILAAILFSLKKTNEIVLPQRIYGNAYDEQYAENTKFHLGKIQTSPSDTQIQYSDLQKILNY